MNILEVNRMTLARLYEQYPENLNGLSLDDNMLVYDGESCDISNFNINDLLAGETNFAASLSVLSAEDIFKIIRLHSIKINSELKVNNAKDEEERKIEIIKEENPLMKNISVVKRQENGSTYHYFNIVDSLNRDHLYLNDRDVNIFEIYEDLKYKNPSRDISPDELIEAIHRKLYDVELEKDTDIVNKENTTEDFANKMRVIGEPYKNDKHVSVYGNEEHDIALISDESDPSLHKVVTFDHNKFGDLVVKNHDQNVSGTETNQYIGDEKENVASDTGVNDEDTSDNQIIEKEEEEVVEVLISSEEFYELLNSPEELTEEQRKNVDLYYAYLGDLVLYEEYLLPELKEILNYFRYYVYDLQYGELPEGMERTLNSKQEEAIKKAEEFEEKVALVNDSELENEKVQESVKKLQLLMPNNNVNRNNNDGNVSIIQIMAIIIGVSIILTALTLYLIK